MTVPTNITDLSTTAASNPPNGSSDTPQEGDDHIRAAYSFIALNYQDKAPKASPTFTGTPVAPTAAVDTNTTQIATTAYVIGQGYAKLASPTFTGTVTAAAVTTTGNTILGDASADTLNVGSGGIVKDSSGNTTFGGVAFHTAGTVSAPGLSFTGDSNTGIYAPAADTVAITTAGTEVMRFGSTGTASTTDSISIGSTTVSKAVQISGVGTANVPTLTVDTAASGGRICIVSGNDNTGAAFCALYVIATRPSGGAGTQLTATLVTRSGSSTPTLTFAVSGTNVQLTTGTGASFTYASVVGY